MDVKSLLILKCFCLLILYYNPIVEGDTQYGICANPECSTPISKGVTLLQYASPDDNRISFGPNEEVEIYVKDYGPKKDLWGVTVRGHRGYISKNFIREKKSLVKQLVPAHIEFKSSVLVTNDYTVTSHVHVSSNHHQPNSLSSNIVSQSVVQTQTHQDLNSVPSSHQHTWSSPNDQLQASHLSPNFGTSNDMQFDLNSQFGQSSLLNNLPEHSSHQSGSGNLYASSPVTGMQSENIFPSQSYKSDSLNQDNSMLHPPFYESELDSMLKFDQQNSLDFSGSSLFNPNYVNPSHTEQSFNEHPSSIQQQSQHFQSQHISEMYSSLYPPDYFDPISDEDISKTYALLNDRGFDDNYMYSDSYSQTQDHQYNPNIKSDGFRQISSSSQYSSIQNNDAFYSSVNPIPSINFDSNTLNSDVLKENINELPQHVDVKTEAILTDKETVLVDEHNAEESQISDEILDESDDDIEDLDVEGEEEEEGEVVEVEVEGTSLVNDGISSSKETENNDSEFLLKSSMSTTLGSEKSTNVHNDVQSSKENLVVDSVYTSAKEHDTEKKTSLANDPVVTTSESTQLKTEVPENSDIIHTATVQISNDKRGEFSDSGNLTKTEFENTQHVIPKEVSPTFHKKSTNFDTVLEKDEIVDKPVIKEDIVSRNTDINNDASQSGNTLHGHDHTTPSINEFFTKEEQDSELSKILNTVNIDSVSDTVGSTYQIRNLKGEHMPNEDQQSESEGGNDENNTESDDFSSFENGLNALKSFVDSIMSWIPEPLYSALMDLQSKGISPRVPVFTFLWGILCILFVVPVYFIKERSKENKLTAQLACVEKKAYTLAAANIVLEEKLENVQSELKCLQSTLEEERTISESLKSELENQGEELESTKAELESYLEELDLLKEKENEYLSLLNNHEKEKENLLEHKSSLDRIITDQENSIASLNDQLQESENTVKELETEKQQYLQVKEDYEEKISHFERNCNQLLQEAEVWNLRVNELTTKVNEESTLKEELEATLKEKNEEIESLKQLVETFNILEEIEDPELESKTKEEKLQSLINSSMILNQLKKEEEKSKVLEEQLGKEKSKILEMEVDLLDAKSEIDKLKLSYNQALQDKAEAQTKLDVLTNYFKDKEIQLQKQLGAQEAVRQKKEEDANSAERRICLIEQENASYKYQVASMKQEMEETERNLKSQIATQEKKAHENWIAARAAERKLEDMKQEVTQLRQRLTLLEREQENWANASREDIIRPVPKRIPGVNEDSGSQDMNTSERGMFPHLHDRLPPMPPMMLPPDRPLPPLPPLPLPPPPMPPMFLPHMEQHFRPQPWHMRPDANSDYRTTPEFVGGRASTPPRGRQSTITDGETGPNTSSPLTTDARDSQNSTPPQLLPDFHDLPPQPGRPFFPPPPPLHHPRLPMHPSHRRDPVPKRLDNPNEYNSRGSQQPPPQEQWQHSRV